MRRRGSHGAVKVSAPARQVWGLRIRPWHDWVSFLQLSALANADTVESQHY